MRLTESIKAYAREAIEVEGAGLLDGKGFHDR